MSNERTFFNGERIFGRIDRIASSYGGSYWRAVIAGKRADYGNRLEDFGSVACADLESVRRELLAIDNTLKFAVARTGPPVNLRARIKSVMFWLSGMLTKATTPGHSRRAGNRTSETIHAKRYFTISGFDSCGYSGQKCGLSFAKTPSCLHEHSAFFRASCRLHLSGSSHSGGPPVSSARC